MNAFFSQQPWYYWVLVLVTGIWGLSRVSTIIEAMWSWARLNASTREESDIRKLLRNEPRFNLDPSPGVIFSEFTELYSEESKYRRALSKAALPLLIPIAMLLISGMVKEQNLNIDLEGLAQLQSQYSEIREVGITDQGFYRCPSINADTGILLLRSKEGKLWSYTQRVTFSDSIHEVIPDLAIVIEDASSWKFIHRPRSVPYSQFWSSVKVLIVVTMSTIDRAQYTEYLYMMETPKSPIGSTKHTRAQHDVWVSRRCFEAIVYDLDESVALFGSPPCNDSRFQKDREPAGGLTAFCDWMIAVKK